MKKLFRSGIALLLVLVTFAACGSKDSVPDEKRIIDDLTGLTIGMKDIDEEVIKSVESVEIHDITNEKSTVGMLTINVTFQYTNEEDEKKERKKSNLYYAWTDDLGWKFSEHQTGLY